MQNDPFTANTLYQFSLATWFLVLSSFYTIVVWVPDARHCLHYFKTLLQRWIFAAISHVHLYAHAGTGTSKSL